MSSSTLPDYLKTPHGSTPSFHFRVGEKPRVPAATKPEQPANEFGYPRPGVQSPSAYSATAPHYFVDEATWKAILDHGDFDDVVGIYLTGKVITRLFQHLENVCFNRMDTINQ